jgi:hypothetical protein
MRPIRHMWSGSTLTQAQSCATAISVLLRTSRHVIEARRQRATCRAGIGSLTSVAVSLRLTPGGKLSEILLRFVIGGICVSVFALIGDLLKPKTFAGLFGAAPSVALATLTLTVLKDGKAFAAVEARSMIAGAAALLIYCVLVMWLLKRDHMRALAATTSASVAWFVIAFGLWLVVRK